jgi:integrase/recombinase XerC
MDYQESFISYLQFEKRSSSHTVTAYQNDLDQFVQYCIKLVGEFNVNNVDAKLVRSWVVQLMGNGLNPSSVNRKVTTVKAFFRYLQKHNVVTMNPADSLPLPKIRKKLPQFVEEKSLNNLLDNDFFDNEFIGTRDKLIISLFYGAGIRLSELTGLTDSNLDIQLCQLKVVGKRNKERIVPYPTSINGLIKKYFELRNELFGTKTGRLLLTGKGEPVYGKLVYRIVKRELGKVTLLEKKSPHVLRHSYATHLMNNGADLNAVKELLGHSNLAATQIYTHTTFKKVHEIYKQAHPRG